MLTGYNAPWLFNQFQSNSYYVSGTVIKSINSLSPQVIRLMGGTLGNYYDINKPAYYGEKDITFNYISPAFDLVNQLPNTDVVFVANVFQALLNPSNINYWIDGTLKALQLLPKIKWVELGNEINISGQYMQVADKPGFFESVTKYKAKVAAKATNYLSISDKFYTAIKSAHPEIEIGIPMGNPFTVRNIEWNRVLRTWTKNDFEIFHIYLTTKTYNDTQTEISKVITGALKPVAITEWSWQHGNSDSNVLNSADIGKDYYIRFFNEFPKICNSLGVKMICRHQLYGDTVYSVIKK